MDGLLKAQGLSQGTVGRADERALGKDPRFLYPNTDQGRAAADRLSERPGGRDPHAPAARLRDPAQGRSGDPARAARHRGRGAPTATSRTARSTARGPPPTTSTCATRRTGRSSRLPTLTFHEGMPGHVWQGRRSRHRLPLMRSLLAFNAYVEGWALYAEQLARRARHVRRRSVRPDRLSAVDPVPRLPAGGRHRPARQALDPRAGDRNGWWTTTAAPGDRPAARSTATAPGPARPAATRSAIPRSTGSGTGRAPRSGPASTCRTFDDALVVSGAVPLTVLDGLVDAYVAARRA